MTTKRYLVPTLVAVVAASVLSTPAWARPPGGPGGGGPFRSAPAFMTELFPPELIMRNQAELGLSDAQKSALQDAIRETRNQVDPMQWQILEEQEKLTTLVQADVVDSTAVLAQAEVVMDLEKRVKKQHLMLLVEIKNQLTPEQREIARGLRSAGRRGGFGRPRRSGGLR